MFWSFISLLAAGLIIVGIWRIIVEFWTWLARGKKLHGIVEEERVDESVRIAVAEADRLDAERKLRKAKVKKRRLSREERKLVISARKAERRIFLDNLRIGWYQVVMLFLIGSVLGLVLEEIWMFISAGLTQSRVGLVWGPFSPLYGFGALLLTLITFSLRKRKVGLWAVFLISLALGGGLEQVTGWGMETLFGLISWDYSGVPGHLTKWVAVPFLIFWGVLGIVWYEAIMPQLLYVIGIPTTRRQVIFVSLLALYLSADIFMTVSCFARQNERIEGIPPQTPLDQWIDDNYTDQWIAGRFQNLESVK